MRLPILKTLAAFFYASILASCSYDTREEPKPEECDTDQVAYAAEIDGILQQNCGSCHRGGSRSGGVVLDSYSDVMRLVTPEEPEASLLYGVTSHTFGKAMPSGGQKIPECQIQQIRAWILQGAPNN